MKTIVLFNEYFGGGGGAERLLLEEEKYFSRTGIHTIVLAFREIDNPFGYTPSNKIILAGSNSRLKNIIKLRQTLKKIRPDLIIAQSPGEARYLYLATLFTSIPYMVHIHGTLFWFIEDRLKYARIHSGVFNEIRQSVAGHSEFNPEHINCNITKHFGIELKAIVDYIAVRKAKQVITLTDHLKWEIKKLYNRDSIVARGCLPSWALNYKPKQDIKRRLGLDGKRIILSIGRLDPRKRIDLLLKSYAGILPLYNDIHLVIGGDGEDGLRLKKMADELKLNSRVSFVGRVPDTELFDYYCACDVFAFPSWTTSGITPYEALAVGKKVVWTTEADEPVLTNCHVFLAEPTVDSFAWGLEKAINSNMDGGVDLSDYTWDKYFDTVYKAALDI